MTTPTEDARAALAEYDACWTQHDAVLVVPEIIAALRALIEPPADDERDTAYRWWRDEFDNSKGVPSYSDAFDAGWDAVLRRQVSHPEPEPVTDEMVKAAGRAFAIHEHGESADQQDADYYARGMRAALEAARAVRLPVPEEGS